ncbi:Hypothetical protein EHI5A_048220 [Entamoeba histolytica KU27]|uniref:Uncharacterized protein n=1 Tax=Entamoeba histolytica KU27 TaxID=885311 RepID=M2Q6R1_ENTHI|nr:Hypothetical protein EHI5A_048220 [Entamoeba histolytica KU27]
MTTKMSTAQIDFDQQHIEPQEIDLEGSDIHMREIQTTAPPPPQQDHQINQMNNSGISSVNLNHQIVQQMNGELPPEIGHLDGEIQMGQEMTPELYQIRMQMLATGIEMQPILPGCPEIDEQAQYITQIQTIDLKPKQANKKEMVKDKDGVLYYCYTYTVKNKDGQDYMQRVYMKKQTNKIKPPKICEEKIDDGRVVVIEKERKLTKQHELLLTFIQTHEEPIKLYNKFVVSRVLQDFKREYPEIKISYGLVKKVLEQQGLLPPKKTYYKLE